MEEIPLTGGWPCFMVLRVKSLFVLAVGGVASLLLSSCGAFDSFGRPLGSDFDPLSAPGGAAAAPQGTAVVAPTYKSGQWVETAMANAAFFRSIPQGNARADKVLPAATPMKVVSTKDTYVKVELESGEVGYVPEIMVVSGGSATPTPGIPDYSPIPAPVDPALATPTPAAPPVPPAPAPGTSPSAPDVPPVPPTVPGVTE